MIHLILENDYQHELEWIVSLQRTILDALCSHETRPDQITTEWFEMVYCRWLKPQMTELDEANFNQTYSKYYRTRIRNFSGRRDKVQNCECTLLENMKNIANLSSDRKDNLKTVFENDQDIRGLFGINSAARITGIEALNGLDESVILAVRGFFESFYEPNFGQKYGYDIPDGDGKPRRFRRDNFLDEFDYSSNKQAPVCCLCDGDRSDVEVDHFYPKSHFPFLSCHPLNLVPICSKCNGSKLEKIPLDLNAANPAKDWFHPYLQVAGDDIEVIFERDGIRHIPELFSKDAQMQVRLDNLDKLVDYRQRWREQLQLKLRLFIKQFVPFFVDQLEAEDIKPPLQDQQLRALLVKFLHQQAKYEKAGFGVDAYSILKYHYIKLAAEEVSFLFDEIWEGVRDLQEIRGAG